MEVESVYRADEVAVYRAEIQPCRRAMSEDFHHLRRILSQIGGFLLLYKSPDPNTIEGIDVSIREFEATLRDVANRLNSLRTSGALSIVKSRCLKWAAALRDDFAVLRAGLGRIGREFEQAFEALPHLRRAPQLLRAAADDRAGMPLVSYCACCAGLGLRAPFTGER